MVSKLEDYLASLPTEERVAAEAQGKELISKELTLREFREVQRNSQAEIARPLA